MRIWAHILLLSALILWFAVSAFAQEVSWNAPDTVDDISPKTGTSLGNIFSKRLAERLRAAAEENRLKYTYGVYDVESSENLDTLIQASLGAAAYTFGKTPLGEMLVDKIARYSTVEYARNRSEKKGRLYAFGKRAAKGGEKDYGWLLKFPIYGTSSSGLRPSIELNGFFWGSHMSARFANDELAIGFKSEKLSDFISALFPLGDTTVQLSVDYELDGSCFAGFTISFEDFVLLRKVR